MSGCALASWLVIWQWRRSSLLRMCVVAALVSVDGTVAPARSQASFFEFGVCATDPNSLIGSRLDEHIFACSKVIADTGVPMEIRAKAYLHRAMSYYIRVPPPGATPNRDTRDLDRAIVDFSEAIRLNSKNAMAYLLRGRIYSEEKADYDKAIRDFSAAIDLRLPEFETIAITMRASAYEKTGNRAGAIADFQTLLSKQPDDKFVQQELNRLRR